MLIVALIIAAMVFGAAGPVVAQDLSDPETCLECHADQERDPPSDPTIPQVHNPEGGFFQEAHEMWSCNDCHTYITEIPHAEGVTEMQVECTNCHDETPKKQ
jgi:hypothetical protein